MSNITFNKIENNVKMYGSNQIGVYVDGVLKYYITESDYAPNSRIFTFPEDKQLGTFINKYKPENFSMMKALVLEHFDELLECEKEHWDYFIKITYVNGLYGSISKEHLAYKIISLDSYGYTREKFSLIYIELLKNLIATNKEEFKDVGKIDIINCVDFSIETININ